MCDCVWCVNDLGTLYVKTCIIDMHAMSKKQPIGTIYPIQNSKRLAHENPVRPTGLSSNLKKIKLLENDKYLS